MVFKLKSFIYCNKTLMFSTIYITYNTSQVVGFCQSHPIDIITSVYLQKWCFNGYTG